MTLTPALCTCGQPPKTHDCAPHSPGHATVYCGHPCRLEARGHDLETATRRWREMILKKATAEIVGVYLRARLLGEIHPHGGLSWNVESKEPASPSPPVRILGHNHHGVFIPAASPTGTIHVTNPPNDGAFSFGIGSQNLTSAGTTHDSRSTCGSIRHAYDGAVTELIVPKWLAEQAFVPAFQQAAADFNRLLRVLHSCGCGIMEALAGEGDPP